MARNSFLKVALFNVRAHYVVLFFICIMQLAIGVLVFGRTVLGDSAHSALTAAVKNKTGLATAECAVIHMALVSFQFTLALYLLFIKLYLLATNPARPAVRNAWVSSFVSFHFLPTFILNTFASILLAQPLALTEVLALLPRSAPLYVDLLLAMYAIALTALKLSGATARIPVAQPSISTKASTPAPKSTTKPAPTKQD